jgi:tartrate dehydratase beta subunit/fumarate hydratase class I family protein
MDVKNVTHTQHDTQKTMKQVRAKNLRKGDRVRVSGLPTLRGVTRVAIDGELVEVWVAGREVPVYVGREAMIECSPATWARVTSRRVQENLQPTTTGQPQSWLFLSIFQLSDRKHQRS